MRIITLLIPLLLIGCTHWRHDPPVTYDQHRLDMRECARFAHGIVGPITVLSDRITPASTAITGLGFAANIAREVVVEQRLTACLTAKGYAKAGLTTNPFGWKP